MVILLRKLAWTHKQISPLDIAIHKNEHIFLRQMVFVEYLLKMPIFFNIVSTPELHTA